LTRSLEKNKEADHLKEQMAQLVAQMSTQQEILNELKSRAK